jgi:MATE family multidrug resistance protein
MIGTTSILVYILKEEIVRLFTSDPQLQRTATSVVWIISFSTFPDGFKGMLKGVIRALGLQTATVYINSVGHWCINLTLQWLLAFHFGLGLTGMWFGKLVLEYFIFFAYSILIKVADWDKIAQKSYERQMKDKEAMTNEEDYQKSI